MAGNQSRGLIAASKTRGWDPTVIPASGDKPAQSLTDFDVDMGNLPGKRVGELPGGPVDAWPDGYDTSIGAPAVPFSSPDVGKENADRRSSGADPFPDMPGAR